MPRKRQTFFQRLKLYWYNLKCILNHPEFSSNSGKGSVKIGMLAHYMNRFSFMKSQCSSLS